jgi:flagellar assembly protein FliH
LSTKTATTFIPQTFDPASIHVTMNPAEAAENARVVAFQQGYNDGLEQARADVEQATTDANNRVRRTIASLRQAIDNFDQREAIGVAGVEDAIVAAAFEIAQAVLQRELNTMTDPGAEAIARALKLVPARVPVIAYLHPEDVATLNANSVPTTNRTIEFVADANVEPGGCIVEAGTTTIDAQISSVLTNVRSALGLASDAAGSSSSNSRTTASEAPLS